MAAAAAEVVSQMWKKHRHRVGLVYFFVGAFCGVVLTKLGSLSGSSSSSSSSMIRASSSALAPMGNGWKNVHVFYGGTKHIRDNSAINNDFFDKINWYSQARQDEVVAALTRNKKNGFFIDLAANDPIKISNSYALETNYGWNGLCFEPNHKYWPGLAYRKCEVIGAVIGEKRMEEIQFRFPNRAGPGGGITGDRFDNKGVSKFDEDFPRYTVTLLEVFQMFNVPKVIDYLSLDVGKLTTASSFFAFVAFSLSVCVCVFSCECEQSAFKKQTIAVFSPPPPQPATCTSFSFIYSCVVFLFRTEGAEDFIMSTFPFDKYRFDIMTLERPSDDMKALLEKHGYKYIKVLKDNSKDTLFVHKSMEDTLDIGAVDRIDTNRVYTEVPSKRKTKTE